MGRIWIIIDMQYLAYRALHSTGDLSYESEPTGVLFGILRTLKQLQETYQTSDIVFAFDSPHSLRRELYADYKVSRLKKKRTDVELAALDGMRSQVNKLQWDLLGELGFPAAYSRKGYEADDIIASVVQNLPKTDQAIIVSADKDLYQLLNRRVEIAKTDRIYTAADFAAEYDVHPTEWPNIKAIAGCETDDVPGVDGVAELTAIKWWRGNLKGKKADAIKAWVESPQYELNLRLVSLPFAGYSNYVPPPAKIPAGLHRPEAWERVCRRYGFDSLLDERSVRRGIGRPVAGAQHMNPFPQDDGEPPCSICNGSGMPCGSSYRPCPGCSDNFLPDLPRD